MKRPSGFDREPENPDPEPREPVSREPEDRAPEPPEPAAPARATRGLGLRAPGPREPGGTRDADSAETDADGRRGVAPPSAEAPAFAAEAGETGIAPTVDLGEVRDLRASGSGSGSLLARLRGGDARGGADRGEKGRRVPDGTDPDRRSPERWVPDRLTDPGSTGSETEPRRTGAGRLSPLGGREVDPVKAAERRLRAAEKDRRAQERRERRRFSAESRKRRRTWWVGLGAVGALALFVAAGVFTPLMAVRSIELVGAESVDAQAVRKALARFDGVPIALVRDADVHRALEPFPRIQSYATELVPPSTLVVRIEERVPVMAVAEGKTFRLYDSAGVLLSTVPELPKSVPVASGKVADLSSKPFSAAARALRDMPAELRAQIVKVTASSDQNVEFELKSGIDVLWGDAENSKRKSIVLQSMLGSKALEGRDVERIDVSSFEAPVFD